MKYGPFFQMTVKVVLSKWTLLNIDFGRSYLEFIHEMAAATCYYLFYGWVSEPCGKEGGRLSREQQEAKPSKEGGSDGGNSSREAQLDSAQRGADPVVGNC